MATLARPDILLVWAGSVRPLPTLPSMGSPCPKGSELDPEVLRGHLWARGHTGCPVNRPSPGQCPAAPSACSRSRSRCMSQERSQVSRPPVGPPGFTAAVGLLTPGVVPGLWCPVHGVHGSLQGGPLSPYPFFSSGALPGAQFWSAGFSSLPTQLCENSSLYPCVDKASCWCHLFFLRCDPDVLLGELSSVCSCPPGAPPQESVWHSLFTKCGSCDCSGRVGADFFSSFHGSGFPDRAVVKNLPANAVDAGWISGPGISTGKGNGIPLQYSFFFFFF